MTNTLTRPVSPLTVAKNRWDEASRVTDAFKNVLKTRTRRAYMLHGQAGELQAWADVSEVETQLAEAERLEVKAWQDVAWEEKRAADQAQLRRARERRGR